MSQFSNLSANSRLDCPTANSGTVYVADAELFGLSTNPIEVSASGTNTSGSTVVEVTSTADKALSGSGETVGDASASQTLSIASGMDKSVSKTILTPSGQHLRLYHKQLIQDLLDQGLLS